ncbi:MAG: hypothetical protein H6766_05370 [Candidatus Peribacteria bacterium]|nr:MAG: hypothetical protein H6766_05370 [Candidatus Peribacteria bacterium]
MHLLPDVVPTPDGQTDIKVTHITTNAGSIYYHHTLDLTDYSAIGTGDYPAFDPTNP